MSAKTQWLNGYDIMIFYEESDDDFTLSLSKRFPERNKNVRKPKKKLKA